MDGIAKLLELLGKFDVDRLVAVVTKVVDAISGANTTGELLSGLLSCSKDILQLFK